MRQLNGEVRDVRDKVPPRVRWYVLIADFRSEERRVGKECPV